MRRELFVTPRDKTLGLSEPSHPVVLERMLDGESALAIMGQDVIRSLVTWLAVGLSRPSLSKAAHFMVNDRVLIQSCWLATAVVCRPFTVGTEIEWAEQWVTWMEVSIAWLAQEKKPLRAAG